MSGRKRGGDDRDSRPAKIGPPQKWLVDFEERFATLMRTGEIMAAVEQLRTEASRRGMSSIELGSLVAQVGIQRGHTNPILEEPGDPP